MIIEQNVSKEVRIWASCQVKLRLAEYHIRQLSQGKPVDYSFFFDLKAMGRKRFLKDVCEPEIDRLQKRCHRYRRIAELAQRRAGIELSTRLLSAGEALALIGLTLHYREHAGERFETLLYCSPDGQRLFGSIHGQGGIHTPYNGLTPLSLLSLWFGKEK